MSAARAPSGRRFLLLLLGVAAAGALAMVAAARMSSGGAGPQESPARTVAGIEVRDRAGRHVALATGRAGVVLVVSYTCPHCHLSLERIAAASRGDTLPGLQVVAMEGADRASTLLAELGVHARALGPDDVAGFAKALRVHAVPLVLETDARGAVLRARVGALDAQEAAALVERTRGAGTRSVP
jgi:hypothetical protein